MSYYYPLLSYSFPKLSRVQVSGRFICYWCNAWDLSDTARLTQFSKRHICEECYIAYRKRLARERKSRRDSIIRREDAIAQREHVWKLKQVVWERRPQPWRDYNRRKLVRILDNMVRATYDAWEREALAGYYALGMEVSK